MHANAPEHNDAVRRARCPHRSLRRMVSLRAVARRPGSAPHGEMVGERWYCYWLCVLYALDRGGRLALVPGVMVTSSAP